MKTSLRMAFFVVAVVGLVAIAAAQMQQIEKPPVQSGAVLKYFTLQVNRDAGVDGTPAAGLHKFIAGSTAAYSFKSKVGYMKLQVMLDGVAVADSGSFVMNKNRVLTADSRTSNRCWLSVALDNGVLAPVPAAGMHFFAKGSTVNYSYKVGANRGIELYINGVSKCKHWPSASGATCSGQFVINANTEILVMTL